MNKDAKKLVRMVESRGWVMIKANGHIQYTHPTRKGKITIPHSNIKNNIIKSVMKQADIKGSISDFKNGRIS